jgi:hypothetical protein
MGCITDHSSLATVAVRNPSTPHYAFMSWCLIKQREVFTFTPGLVGVNNSGAYRHSFLRLYGVRSSKKGILLCLHRPALKDSSLFGSFITRSCDNLELWPLTATGSTGDTCTSQDSACHGRMIVVIYEVEVQTGCKINWSWHVLIHLRHSLKYVC